MIFYPHFYIFSFFAQILVKDIAFFVILGYAMGSPFYFLSLRKIYEPIYPYL